MGVHWSICVIDVSLGVVGRASQKLRLDDCVITWESVLIQIKTWKKLVCCMFALN